MRKKISEVLLNRTKLFLFVMMAIACVCRGFVVTILNTKESKIVRGFSYELFGWVVGCYIGLILINYITNLFSKAYRVKVRDEIFLNTLTKTLNSKIVNLQTISSGKVFDTVSELTGLKTNRGSMVVEIIPVIIPFINLIDSECKSTLICISHNEGFDRICDSKILVKDGQFYPQTINEYCAD